MAGTVRAGTFGVDGLRLGCALGIEVHFPDDAHLVTDVRTDDRDMF